MKKTGTTLAGIMRSVLLIMMMAFISQNAAAQSLPGARWVTDKAYKSPKKNQCHIEGRLINDYEDREIVRINFIKFGKHAFKDVFFKDPIPPLGFTQQTFSFSCTTAPTSREKKAFGINVSSRVIPFHKRGGPHTIIVP